MEANLLIVPAFLAGILMFFAPCTFPLVPAFLGMLSGVSAEDLREGRGRRKLIGHALLFVFGFSVVFILFGTMVAWGGQFLFPYRRWLERLAGVFIIVFGLSLLGLYELPLLCSSRKLALFRPETKSRPIHSLLVGAAFGTAWTPCIGPILGSILLLATTSGTVGEGAGLLAIFSLGFAIPFLLVAMSVGTAMRLFGHLRRFIRALEVLSGSVLVSLGFLVFTQRWSSLMGFGFRLFDFLNYERLLDYL